jgi:hypothetical protein
MPSRNTLAEMPKLQTVDARDLLEKVHEEYQRKWNVYVPVGKNPKLLYDELYEEINEIHVMFKDRFCEEHGPMLIDGRVIGCLLCCIANQRWEDAGHYVRDFPDRN